MPFQSITAHSASGQISLSPSSACRIGAGVPWHYVAEGVFSLKGELGELFGIVGPPYGEGDLPNIVVSGRDDNRKQTWQGSRSAASVISSDPPTSTKKEGVSRSGPWWVAS